MDILKEHKENLQKWICIFRKLCDKCEQTSRVKELILKVQKHIWLIEWRLYESKKSINK